MREKEFIKLESDPMAMSTETLLTLFEDEGYTYVIRSLLVTEKQRCDDERVPIRTLRNVWYKRIKPILSRIGLLDEDRYYPKEVPDFAAKLSVVMADMVRDGVCSYRDMSIIDGSRQRRPAYEVTTPMYKIPLVGVHHPELILFTEKDTVWPIVQRLASIYGVSAISGKGQPSLACTEDMIAKIFARSVDPKASWKDTSGIDALSNIVLLTLTDYDPMGYVISRAQHTQLCDILSNEPWEIEEEPRIVRLGLEPEQLSAADRYANAYKPKGKGLAKWFAETGGVDGEPLGLELDALELTEFRRLFVTGIKNEIGDEEPYHEELRAAFVDLMASEAAKDEVQALLDGYRAKLDDLELKCKDDVVEEFALEGFASIDPVKNDAWVFNAKTEAEVLLSAP